MVWAGIVGLTGLAWLELWQMSRAMSPDMGMLMAMPQAAPWSPALYGAAALMWAVMMVAMMLPSAAPMLLLFAGVQQRRAATGGPVVSTGLFGVGYLLLWTGFSLLAAGVQLALQRFLVLSPRLSAATPILAAVFLLLAGAYQWTPWKNLCLSHCQSPMAFITRHWRNGRRGAIRMGMEHGWYCLGCCWALMGLLFVGGVMNLLWVAALALFVLLEKLVARGPGVSRVAGALFVAWGALLLVQAG